MHFFVNIAKCRGMTLDTKFWWKEHIEITAYQTKKIDSQKNRLLYKQILKPSGCMVFSSGVVLRGVLPRWYKKNKVLRKIVSAPWYIKNNDIHRNFEVKLYWLNLEICCQPREATVSIWKSRSDVHWREVFRKWSPVT